MELTTTATIDQAFGPTAAAARVEEPIAGDDMLPPDTEEAADAVAETSAEKHSMRWLEPGEYNGDHVAIVSYPRSGNSLMRGLLEKVTGVFTGCDTRPDRTLSQQLQDFGMKGEVRA
jgi:hypothetical protein